jgi:hypothetical protein
MDNFEVFNGKATYPANTKQWNANMAAVTYTLEEGFKLLAKKKAFSRAFPEVKIVPAWRLAFPLPD